MFDFSIVTPSLNQGAYIQRNLESVSEQNDVTVEHLVIDGLSTDATMEIVSSFKSNHDLRWISEKDKGQTDAINKGLRLCNGKILAYLNSDDCLYAGNVLKQVKSIMDSTGVDILYGDVEVIDGRDIHTGYIRGRPFKFERMIKSNYIPQPATFFRASVVEKIGYFREELRYAMDLEYWLRAASYGLRLHYDPLVISCFREHEASKTCSQTKALIDEGYGVVRKEYFSDAPIALWMYHKLASLKLALR